MGTFQRNAGNKHQEMDTLIKRYKEICADLNMNKSAADEALSSFNRIGNNYSLEVCDD